MARQWKKLDNAAKIFPPTSTARDPRVFRFSCTLREPVDPALLERALAATLPFFPLYRSVLKKGLFWYYFEDSGRGARVGPESLPPCAPIYTGDSRRDLYRVSYYGCRVNLEVYHALSDGAGALRFLQTLLCQYLFLAHPDEFDAPPETGYGATQTERADDSFKKYYDRPHRAGRPAREPAAYHQRGERLPDDRMGLIQAHLPVRGVLDEAHRHGATLTELLTAALLCAIGDTMSLRERRRPVVIAVPVNLRPYFPSESARNFFCLVSVGCRLTGGETFEQVVAAVHAQFGEKLTRENLFHRMNELAALEHNIPIRMVPLGLKIPALKLGNWWAERRVTAALSNLGRVDMPAGTKRYIRCFDVCTHTNRLQACLCSFGDTLSVSFTTPFCDTDIQRYFIRRLTALGLSVEIAAAPDFISD